MIRFRYKSYNYNMDDVALIFGNKPRIIQSEEKCDVSESSSKISNLDNEQQSSRQAKLDEEDDTISTTADDETNVQIANNNEDLVKVMKQNVTVVRNSEADRPQKP